MNQKLEGIEAETKVSTTTNIHSLPIHSPIPQIEQKSIVNSEELVCSIENISFILPRKKININISSKTVTLLNSNSKAQEKQFPISSVERYLFLILLIGRIICVPTPDSRQKNQWSFVLFIKETKDPHIVFTISADNSLT